MTTPGSPPTVVVTAAVVETDGRFLVARRLDGTHLAGLWEFPGGKCEPGEDASACLAREIHEELGATARVGEEIHRTRFEYPDRLVELRFFRCQLEDEPRPLLGQEVRWADRAELATLEFPPADAELIARLTDMSRGDLHNRGSKLSGRRATGPARAVARGSRVPNR